MTRDEALTKAHHAGMKAASFAHFSFVVGRGDDLITTLCKAYAKARDASLREGGWTLARVDPTEESVDRVAEAICSSWAKWRVKRHTLRSCGANEQKRFHMAAKAATPAVALCIAILRAKAEEIKVGEKK